MSTEPAQAAADRPAAESTACFAVHAAADPGLMPRIVEIFARRGLVPTRFHGTVAGLPAELTVDVEMAGLGREAAMRIAAEMRALWGVSLVLTTEKRAV
jgi:hypothetical protein